MQEALKGHIKRTVYRVPGYLRERQIEDTQARTDRVRSALERHYFQGWRARETMSAATYARDLHDHLLDRLHNDRMRVIPWLDSVSPLNRASILEIGCGTGASTVALAEQGAKIIAVDIDEDALEAAKVRCAAYGVSAEIVSGNAVEVLQKRPAVNTILFFACLEHMTHEERIESLRLAWQLLPNGGKLAVIETPNRLWYRDNHTALMPFFHWLPDDLALEYSKLSPREVFNTLYTDKSQMEHFLRRGRGVSFHEFDVAIGVSAKASVKSCLADFHKLATFLRLSRADRMLMKVFASVQPQLHRAWFHESLDLILVKQSG